MTSESFGGFGKTCVIEQLDQLARTSTQAPEKGQLCYYRPNAADPQIICGVIGRVVSGFAGATDGGESVCQKSCGGTGGISLSEAKKAGGGSFLGAAFKLTTNENEQKHGE
jgi:hypothetical protein